MMLQFVGSSSQARNYKILFEKRKFSRRLLCPQLEKKKSFQFFQPNYALASEGTKVAVWSHPNFGDLRACLPGRGEHREML